MSYPKLEVVPINPEVERNYTPMHLELTDKAKAMIPNRCPYCECGLLPMGNNGKDFGGCPADSFKLLHNFGADGWTIEVNTDNGKDMYGVPQSVYSESAKVHFCPMCGRKLDD